jgi:hypothetical protein
VRVLALPIYDTPAALEVVGRRHLSDQLGDVGAAQVRRLDWRDDGGKKTSAVSEPAGSIL